VVVNERERVIGGLHERAGSVQPNEPALESEVFSKRAFVYWQLDVPALVEIAPGIFELILSDTASLCRERRSLSRSIESLRESSEDRDVGVKRNLYRRR
jgi:hypothetical protein